MEIHVGGEWKVRSWSWEDVASCARYANNRKVWINLADNFPHPYSEDDAKAWIQSVKEREFETMFAIASADEAIGGIGFNLKEDIYRRTAELGYWLGEPFWGKGIATMALRAVTEYAFANFDIARLYAQVFEWNPASARVLEKAGFTLESRVRKGVTKDGKTIDLLMYALIRDERPHIPNVRLAEVTRDNWVSVVALAVHPEQQRFVPPVVRSVAKAYIRPEGPPVSPYAIYADGLMVGFCTTTCDSATTDIYFIGGFLIDRAYQRRGYGKAALKEIIKLVKDKYPKCESIGLTVHPENRVAQHLYKSFGFEDTGQIYDDELVYRLGLR